MSKKTCIFYSDEYAQGEGSNIWECSNCKEVFNFEEGTPLENSYNYCPHCGARIMGQE